MNPEVYDIPLVVLLRVLLTIDPDNFDKYVERLKENINV